LIVFPFAFSPGFFALSRRMAQEEFDINYVADLARIELSNDEKAILGAQLGDILKYVDQLKEVDVENVKPTAHSVKLTNVTRVDEVQESLPQEEALRNAPARVNGMFKVPEIIE